MDRLNRTDSSYLKLFTQEHEFLNQEKISLHSYKLKESEERDLFFRFSALLRESQEKERARAERIKYIQLFLSVSCTFLGLLSALLISFLRRTEIKEILDFEKKSFVSIESKLEGFDKEQRDFNDSLKVYLNNNSKLNENLGKQNKVLFDNILQNFANEINSNKIITKNPDEINSSVALNELELSKKINKQQDMLKLVSVTTVLSTFFLCLLYFKGN